MFDVDMVNYVVSLDFYPTWTFNLRPLLLRYHEPIVNQSLSALKLDITRWRFSHVFLVLILLLLRCTPLPSLYIGLNAI